MESSKEIKKQFDDYLESKINGFFSGSGKREKEVIKLILENCFLMGRLYESSIDLEKYEKNK